MVSQERDSCCIDLGIDEENEDLYEDMDAISFLEFYKSVVGKTFSKL